MQSYQIFEGLKVLELASVLAGPSVGQFFAELGATVIKVENPHSGGDVTRSWKLPSEDLYNDRPAYFSAVNWGKKSMAVNISTNGGLDIVQKLIAQSDVVISSYKPGDAKKFGLDYESLKSLYPGLVYGSITGYAEPSKRTGYDAIIQAESGFMYINGEANGNPLKMPVALIDVLAGHHLKEGILLALFNKLKNGSGAKVEVSLMDAAISSLVNQATNYLHTGINPERTGSEHPNIAPYGTIFPTRDDKQIVLAIGNDAQFKKLCELIDLKGLELDHRFVNNHSRVENRAELSILIAKKTKILNSDVLLTAFIENGIPAGIIRSIKEMLDSSEAKHMIVQNLFMQGIRNVAFKFNGAYAKSLNEPPHLGENNMEIIEDLGYSELEIAELKISGAIA